MENIRSSFQNDLHEALKAKEQESGVTLGQLIVGMAYNEEVPGLARVQAMRLIFEVLGDMPLSADDEVQDGEETGPDNLIPFKRH